MKSAKQLLLLTPVILFAMGCTQHNSASSITTPYSETALLTEDFEQDMERWWVEGAVEAWTQDGRLYVNADSEDESAGSVATVWCRQPIQGNVKIEIDAHVISSRVASNNINLFLFYSDPNGQPLEATASFRADAAYQHYHDLTGYIVTFVRDWAGEPAPYADPNRTARVRIRRCPGFTLLNEIHTGHSEQGVTYHLTVLKFDNQLVVKINDQITLSAYDEHPPSKGLLGLRTFRTKLWWDNLRVTPLTEEAFRKECPVSDDS